MILTDVEQVVDIHLSSFTGFFLSSMGVSFLKIFYEAALFDNASIAFVVEQEQRIFGFVAGTTQPEGFYKRILGRNWYRFLLACVVPILKQPLTALRLMQRLLMVRENQHQVNQALLLSIAVSPTNQGRGLGGQLLKAFIQESRKHGLSSVKLTTDAQGNEPVNRFYQKNGFELFRTYVGPENREMNEYITSLV